MCWDIARKITVANLEDPLFIMPVAGPRLEVGPPVYRMENIRQVLA